MRHQLLITAALSAAVFTSSNGLAAPVGNPQITAGTNFAAVGPQVLLPVEWDSSNAHYLLNVDLTFSTFAPPMTKAFESPREVTGAPILLDALQPFPLPVWENFHLQPGSLPVSDWHEEILTPGWEWRFAPPGAAPSLITKNGQPWPWQHQPHPGGPDPSMLWVEFPAIEPPNILDVHKEMVWVGTPGNRIWGDNVLDDGTTHDESAIIVLEYPTPEPSTLGLLALGALGLVRRRR